MSGNSEIKLKMLNEFERQSEIIFNEYFENRMDFNDCISKIRILKTVWDFCRIDIKNFGIESNLIKILDSDNNLKISFPVWFGNEQGQGCKIETDDGILDFSLQCINDGNLNLFMRGIDYRDVHGVRNPVYMNYVSLKYNGQTIFEDEHFQWHDDYFLLKRACRHDEIVNLKIEYRTIYDYFPILKTFFNNINRADDLNEEYESFKRYMDYEKSIFNESSAEASFDSQDTGYLLSSLNENISNLSKHYNDKLTSLEKEFTEFKRDSENTINSYYELFNTVFLYYDVKPKGFLKCNHDLNQELLDFVVNVCKKYDLEYFLDYGLLLGALRHNGFIPWDDDVDIGMIREDYDKFLKVIPGEIERNGLSHLLKISLNMHMFKPLPVLQLLYYCEEVEDTIIAGIDIFPYDFIEDISNCNEYSFKKVQRSVTNKNRNGMPIGEALQEYYDAFNLDYTEKQYIIPGVEGARGNFSGYKFVIFKTEDIYPLKELEFENKMYTAPNNPEAYLTLTYGNYLNIPKVIHHHHDRFDKLREREDGYRIFEKNIYKLKKINASYIV